MKDNLFDFKPIGFYSSQQKRVERDSRRAFTQTQKNEILSRQNYKCAKCHKPLDLITAEFDHIKPWEAGGRTITSNGRALCADCHKRVTHKTRLKKVDKNRKRKPEYNNPFTNDLLRLNSKKLKNNPFRLI